MTKGDRDARDGDDDDDDDDDDDRRRRSKVTIEMRRPSRCVTTAHRSSAR